MWRRPYESYEAYTERVEDMAGVRLENRRAAAIEGIVRFLLWCAEVA